DGIRDATVTGVQTCALPISTDAADPRQGRGQPVLPRGDVPRGRRAGEPPALAGRAGHDPGAPAGADRPPPGGVAASAPDSLAPAPRVLAAAPRGDLGRAAGAPPGRAHAPGALVRARPTRWARLRLQARADPGGRVREPARVRAPRAPRRGRARARDALRGASRGGVRQP